MAAPFIPLDRTRPDEDHLARFIVDVVEQLDLTEIEHIVAMVRQRIRRS